MAPPPGNMRPQELQSDDRSPERRSIGRAIPRVPAGSTIRLRREHSDGEVVGAIPGAESSGAVSGPTDRETMLEFLHHTANTLDDDRSQDRARLARREASFLQAQGRLRRQAERRDHTRRMTAPTLSTTHSARGLRGGGPGIEHADGPAGRAALDRPLPATPISAAASQSQQRSLEAQVPRWQLDDEVSECPICRMPFSFLRRKHHCRKCGKVVCGRCSPHRIAIPQQCIVRPPEQQYAAQAIIDLTGEGESNISQEQPLPVRLCNPCVPDPHPMPSGSSTIEPLAQPFSYQPVFNAPQGSPFPQAPPVRQSSTHGFPNGQPYVDPRTLAALHASPANGLRQLSAPSGMLRNATPSSYVFNRSADFPRAASGAHHRPHNSTNSINPGYLPPHVGGAYSNPNIQPQAPQSQPQQRPQPRPQIPEEDECPICHQELPPKGPNGDEAAREAHVSSCIDSRLSLSTPSQSVGRSPPPIAATMASPSAGLSSSTPVANAVSALSTSSASSAAATNTNTTTHPLFQQQWQRRRQTTGMVIYHATEKDCTSSSLDGSDGKPQECIICFEEFAPGDELGRLECLCKFHRQCIRDWWATKGPGSCPVHQQQEGIF